MTERRKGHPVFRLRASGATTLRGDRKAGALPSRRSSRGPRSVLFFRSTAVWPGATASNDSPSSISRMVWVPAASGDASPALRRSDSGG